MKRNINLKVPPNYSQEYISEKNLFQTGPKELFGEILKSRIEDKI